VKVNDGSAIIEQRAVTRTYNGSSFTLEATRTGQMTTMSTLRFTVSGLLNGKKYYLSGSWC